MIKRHFIFLLVLAAAFFSAQRIWADTSESGTCSGDQRWLAKFQSTYTWQDKPEFHVDYSGANSLSDQAEKSYTFSGTAFLGLCFHEGTELYLNPEVVQGVPLSGLTGLGGETNGEAEKAAGDNPTFYRARLFLRQTFNLGGDQQNIAEGFNQFAGTVSSRRLVFTVGNFALTDLFDGNVYAHDPRTQFLNWTLMDYGAWDFAADTRGYTRGIAAEYYDDDWVWRLARVMLPAESNGLELNPHLFSSHADNAELEHDHIIGGQPGKLRALVYSNTANMGDYQAAIAEATMSGGVPNLALVRERHSKTGYGLSLEQSLNDTLGVFARYSQNDGHEEEYAFAEVDRSMQAGLSLKGASWRRPEDTVGIGVVRNELSDSHREYLADGGLGYFLGDGQLTYHPEELFETYYSDQLTQFFAVTLDYQHMVAPGYNADRGPVNFYALRLHAEY